MTDVVDVLVRSLCVVLTVATIGALVLFAMPVTGSKMRGDRSRREGSRS